MSVAAVALSAATAFAQTPNFAGHWVQQVDPNAPARGAAAGGGGGGGGRAGGRAGGMGGGFGGLGMEFTIAQDAKTLTISRTGPQGDIKTVYNLDGSESKNTMTFGANSIDQVSKAKWDGGKLVVTTTTNMAGGRGPMESTQTFSLDASGNLLVERPVPAGRGGAAGGAAGAPQTVTTTYKKG
jgi:hypothetical protein